MNTAHIGTEDALQRAAEELGKREDDLKKILGENYKSDPRYAVALRGLASGRSVQFVIADLEDKTFDYKPPTEGGGWAY